MWIRIEDFVRWKWRFGRKKKIILGGKILERFFYWKFKVGICWKDKYLVEKFRGSWKSLFQSYIKLGDYWELLDKK
jgi:hypothetical protein